MAIVVDDEILAMPVINEAIANGRVGLTLGRRARPTRERFAEARRIAAARANGGLTDRWNVSSIRAR